MNTFSRVGWFFIASEKVLATDIPWSILYPIISSAPTPRDSNFELFSRKDDSSVNPSLPILHPNNVNSTIFTNCNAGNTVSNREAGREISTRPNATLVRPFNDFNNFCQWGIIKSWWGSRPNSFLRTHKSIVLSLPSQYFFMSFCNFSYACASSSE